MSQPNGKVKFVYAGELMDQSTFGTGLAEKLQRQYEDVWYNRAPDAHRIGIVHIVAFAESNGMDYHPQSGPNGEPVLAVFDPKAVEEMKAELEDIDDPLEALKAIIDSDPPVMFLELEPEFGDLFMVQTEWEAELGEDAVTFKPRLAAHNSEALDVDWTKLAEVVNPQLKPVTYTLGDDRIKPAKKLAYTLVLDSEIDAALVEAGKENGRNVVVTD